MNVTVRLFASLRQFGPDEQVSAFPEGTTIDDVIHTLSVPGTIRILRIVNGEHRPADHVLKDGDELALFPPIAGGSCSIPDPDKPEQNRGTAETLRTSTAKSFMGSIPNVSLFSVPSRLRGIVFVR